MPPLQDRLKLSRRVLIKAGALTLGQTVLAACVPPTPPSPVAESQFPQVQTNQTADIILRQMGSTISLGGLPGVEEIAKQVKADLGFTLELTARTPGESIQQAITQPDAYDIWDSEYFNLPLAIRSGALQGLDVTRMAEFDRIVPIFTTGKLTDTAAMAQGTAPHKVMFLPQQYATSFATSPTNWATMIPTIYNADTLGYRPDLVEETPVSWAALFAPAYRGQTAIMDIPSIGIVDAAMGVEAVGLMEFGDKGNMTTEELDRIIAILKEQKALGQFHSFWKTREESADLMASGAVVLQSMWVAAVIDVRQRGFPCLYPALREGYRAWGSGLGISAAVEGLKLDATYDYLNWWLSGFAGGFFGREGYYCAIPENARNFMSPNEWEFWYEGKPATEPIIDPLGTELSPAGATRDGGSFWQRMGHAVVWNSVMDEQDYLVQKWHELHAA